MQSFFEASHSQSPHLFAVPHRDSTPLESLNEITPFYLSCASLALIFAQLVLRYRDHGARLLVQPISRDAGFCKRLVDARGGCVTFSLMIGRVLGCVSLLALSLYPAKDGCSTGQLYAAPGWPCWSSAGWQDILMSVAQLYTSLLATVSFFSAALNKVITPHVVVVHAGMLYVYLLHDVWQFVAYGSMQFGLDENWIIWCRIAILSYTVVIMPLLTPRKYMPIDPVELTKTPNPEQTASAFSLITFRFLDPIIEAASTVAHLPYDQLPPLADYDRADNIKNAASGSLTLDSTDFPKKQHLFRSLIYIHRHAVYMMLFTIIVQALTSFAPSIAINRILAYLERDSVPKVRAWVWPTLLLFGPITNSIARNWYTFVATRSLVRTESLLSQLLLDKTLRLRLNAESISSQESASSTNVSDATNHMLGKLNNMVTVDLANISDAKDFLLVVLLLPLQVILCIAFLYIVLGWSAFVGLAIMIVFMPLPGFIAKKVQGIEVQKMKKTDARVQAVTEAVSVLRMIKLFGWEQKTATSIETKREDELQYIWKRKIADLANGVLNFVVISATTMLATFAVYTVVMKGNLNASKIFSSMSVFALLRMQFRNIFMQLGPIIQGKVSLDRINDYLQNAEVLAATAPHQSELRQHDREGHIIGFNNVTFSWERDTDGGRHSPNSSKAFKLRVEGKVLFQPNCLNLVVGPTGSGKTSLLMALLGEMYHHLNQSDSWFSLPRERGISYSAQEPWIQNDTIRNNILFGSAYDQDRYLKVIGQCALEEDFASFEANDLTEVGERGLTLSGGQKARVSLARAVYSPAEILLVDDIFASLDNKTAQWIVDNCFSGELMQTRTVVLVTNHPGLVRSIAKHVVTVGHDGTVKGGATLGITHEDKSDDGQPSTAHRENLQGETTSMEPKAKPEAGNGMLIASEEVASGRVAWKALRLFLINLGGSHPYLFVLVCLSGITFAECANMLQLWILGQWGLQYETHDPSEVRVSIYLGGYIGILLAIMVIYTSSYLSYVRGTLRAARTINSSLLKAIFGTTFRWLDTTPTSRIIARCTQDMRAVDGPISTIVWTLSELGISMITKFSVAVYFNPLFLLPGILTTFLGFYTSAKYLKAQLSVKREMSNAKAPVLSYFGATIAGLVSIRAYGCQETFQRESSTRIDRYTRIARTAFNLDRWMAVRIEFLGALLTTGLAVYILQRRSVNSANSGLSLNIMVDFCNMILLWVRLYTDFEVQSNSLERINDYIGIEQEPKPTKLGQPPAAWPTSGSLEVDRLSARYSDNGPRVLHELSFSIQSGERVGIVGRTGSGKTSLTLALLRCIPTDGEVRYDGIPTNSVNLDALRSNITIIPQMPELLAGPLRRNLDPFEQNDDLTLQNALRDAGLYSLQEDGEEGRLTLDSKIAIGGSNLSVGQRQIIALARAMVRRSKLLIFDEATSSIDTATDSIIQESLRTKLDPDVTVITIAHRLQTVMDSDKIMVLDKGRIVEFGTPNELIRKEGGVLQSLVERSGDRGLLYSAAKDT